MREGTGNFQNGDLLYMATHPVADAIRIARTISVLNKIGLIASTPPAFTISNKSSTKSLTSYIIIVS